VVGFTETSSKMQSQACRSYVDDNSDQTSGTSTSETSMPRSKISTVGAADVSCWVSSVTVDVVNSVIVARDVAPMLVVST
jgi:hypothetical protein